MDDRRILDLYPPPLARGHRRYLNASEPKERHDHGYFLFESYLLARRGGRAVLSAWPWVIAASAGQLPP